MQSRMLTRRLWTLLLSLSLLWVTPVAAPAQDVVRIAPQAMESLAELDEIFMLGSQLERQGRWGEAFSHYESALRKHPGRQDIEQRLTQARVHYDLARRYVDASFLDSLNAMSEKQALDIYSAVLVKIQTHYVDEPKWHELFQRGTVSLDVALQESTFVMHHLPRATREQIDAFRAEVAQALASYNVRSREDAVHAASWVAQRGRQQLQLAPAATILEYTCGAANALDTYSAFLTAGQLNEVFSQIDGNFVGLGVELKADQNALLIVSTIPGSPAAQAGIVSGDRIVEVDGVSTAAVSTEAAADLLKGVEGSTTRVTVVSPQETRRQVQLVRRRVDVPSLEDIRMLDAERGIAYFRLANFQKSTSQDIDRTLWDLHRQGMRSLIIDLRGNPGGLLRAAVEVADKFVSEGAIVSTRGRSSYEDVDYRAHTVGTWRVPLIVLIDGNSASASEIFAGAIRDHRRGTVIGQRSYGKGSVQGIFPLEESGAGIRLTTAKFYSPNGHPISYRGVMPDIVIEETHTVAKPVVDAGIEAPQAGQDSVIQRALTVARQQMAS